MDDKRIHLLKEAPIYKAVNAMSLPAIIGMLVLGIYNVVDTMFVAWLGTEATGATQVVFPLVMLASSIGLAFGIGGGSYLSRLLGTGNIEKGNRVVSTAFFSSIGAGILFTILCIIGIEPILMFFGADESVMTLSKIYGTYIILGATFTMANMTMNNLLRAEGSSKLSMIGMAAGAILNIILDPIFIFVFNWGIAGAAIATSLSQVVTFSILLSRYLSHHTVTRINIKFFTPTKEIYTEIFKIGIPTFLRQLLFSVSIALLNGGAVTYGGAQLLAAVGIIFKVVMLPMYIIFGLGQGVQPVIGYNFGAKNKKRVMGALKYTLVIAGMIAIISSIILALFAPQFMQAFRAEEAVANYGIKGLRYYAISVLLMSISNTIGVFYQAIGKGKQSLLLSIARQGIFFIPVIILLPIYIGTQGILVAQLVADGLTLILAVVMFAPFINNQHIDQAIMLHEQTEMG